MSNIIPIKRALISVSDNDLRYLPSVCFRYEVGEDPILEALERAYAVWKDGNWKAEKVKALEKAKDYGWNLIWEKYWNPIFEMLEKRLQLKK